MSIAMKSAFICVLLTCLLDIAAGIVCHSCQYATCADGYDVVKKAGNLGDCGDDMYCVKYKTMVWIYDSGEITGNQTRSSVVTRSCESSKGKEEGCIGWSNNGGVTIKCWCGSDGCNAGTSLQPSLGNSLLLAVSLVLLLIVGPFLPLH